MFKNHTLFWFAGVLAIGTGAAFLKHIIDEEMPILSDKTEISGENEILAAPYKKAITSYFWVGEDASPENGFISNAQSAWDANWVLHFGGVDDPHKRCGFYPCGFIPNENPFYFALPYTEFDYKHDLKSSTGNIPWAEEAEEGAHLLKNRWIEIVHKGKKCYAQWEDVGPFETDDFEYVFGKNEVPKNTFGLKAGLDVSPAVRDCLGLSGSGETFWRFVPAADVPMGPWREIITIDML